MYRLVCLSFVFSTAFGIPVDDLLVETPSGKIKGSILTNQNGDDFLSFRGIPYAEAPIGDLRFRDPVPKTKWDGVLDATKDGSSCPQPDVLAKVLNQSEDCLILNVYTKNINGNAPVMFNVHGGAYLFGTSNSETSIGPRYLLNKDVVLVSINYRIGVLGFAKTATADATGNFGMKDMVLALKWVQENIRSFGGNPDLVTVFGHSAGGMAASALIISPMTKGLVHRAIILSGSCTNANFVNNEYWTEKMAAETGCTSYENPTEMIDCLRTVDWRKFVEVSQSWEKDQVINLKFNMAVEDDFGQEMFISKHPSLYFANGEFPKIPIMAGITKSEFEIFGPMIYKMDNFKPILNEINENFGEIAPKLFMYNPNCTRAGHISQTLKEKYLNNQPISEENVMNLGDIFSEAIISHGNHRLISLVRNFANIYYYRIDYENNHTFLTLSYDKQLSGVMHGDDLQYLFNYEGSKFIMPSDSDNWMVQTITTLLTNFAKSGNPNCENMNPMWTPTNKSKFSMYHIDREPTITSDVDPYIDRYNVWDELFPIN